MGTEITEVYMICNAYESGIGHGLQRDGVCNPKNPGSKEYEAWKIGYAEGIDRSKQDVSANAGIERQPRE